MSKFFKKIKSIRAYLSRRFFLRPIFADLQTKIKYWLNQRINRFIPYYDQGRMVVRQNKLVRQGLVLISQIKPRQTIILFALVMIIAGFLHGYNMFHYPYFESDEGTYLSQAFAVKSYGELSLYVYWYDHPPFGWMTLAVWMDIFGDSWNAFGSSLNSGRFLMFVLHLIQVGLIFFMTNRATKSPWLALLAGVLYSASPVAVYFQRRVLLDNIMVTWILLTAAVLHLPKIKLRHILISAVFYGAAVLTKVTAVMFGPAFLYLLLTAKWNINKGFRTMGWLAVSICMVFLWFIYAVIKTEFLPAPNDERVSLIGGILYQASRGSGAYFWQATSSFRDNIGTWMNLDATFVYLLALGVLAAFLLAIFRPIYRFYALATLFYVFFLIRGGVVIGFYILPLIPFAIISLVIGLKEAKELVSSKIKLSSSLSLFLIVILVVVGVWHYAPKVHKYLTVDETSNQLAALRWIKENLPENTTILSDIYGMTELLNPSFVNEKVFSNVDWYFKVSKDPAIRFLKYRDDWRNFDYIFISHEMLYQTSLHRLPVVYDAIRNSQPLIRWDENSTSHTDVQNFLSTNGDWAALYRVNNNTKTQLLYAWNYYKNNFIESYGQVIDPQSGDLTTSEGQAYAMLRAVLMNDEVSFKGLWLWTQHHLQHRLDDKLISWKWEDGRQTDSNNATDADIDIALALIFASKMFNNPEYLEDAREIVADIWRQTVVNINGTYYLLPAEKITIARGGGYLLNPSYFSPAHYRVFAEVDNDPERDWLKLADDSYLVLNRLKRWGNNTTGLPPNWVWVSRSNGGFSSAAPYINQTSTDYFSYDAFRTLWRVALDVSWYSSDQGQNYLEDIGRFFEREWANRRNFAAIYDLDGQRLTNFESMAVSAGILSALNFSAGPEVSSDVYNTLFVDRTVVLEDEEYAYWGNQDNYYDANWIWFGLALFNNNLPNLWSFYR